MKTDKTPIKKLSKAQILALEDIDTWGTARAHRITTIESLKRAGLIQKPWFFPFAPDALKLTPAGRKALKAAGSGS